MSDKNTPLTLFLFLSFISLFTSLFTSCSHEETVPVEKKYSASTEKEFAEIEKGDVKKSIPPAHDLQRPVEKMKTSMVPPPSSEPAQLSGSEKLQEINQQLAYYCMKHRKSFRSEEQCHRFTRTIVDECRSGKKAVNSAVVNCLKDRLKKRR